MNSSTNLSRRDFFSAGALGVFGIAASAAIPSLASAQEIPTNATPSISVQIKDKQGKTIDSYNPLPRLNPTGDNTIRIIDAQTTSNANPNGTYSAQCTTIVGATPPPHYGPSNL